MFGFLVLDDRAILTSDRLEDLFLGATDMNGEIP
jgi:hypothetical protein